MEKGSHGTITTDNNKIKKTEIVLYSFFFIGIIFKLFRLPYHTWFILTTLLIILIYYIYCLISKKKEIYNTLTGLVTFAWLFYLLTILKLFSFQNIVGLMTIFVSAIIFFLLVKNKKIISANSLFCGIIISITIFFKILPTHYTYYLFGIKFNHRIEKDYFTLDKYSWFLYNAHKQAEAIEINKQAQKAVEISLENPEIGDEQEYSILIKKHELEIRNGSWSKYP